MRQLHALPRGVPDRRAGRAGRARLDPLPLVSDDRAARADSRRACAPALGAHVYGCDICQDVCPVQPARARVGRPAWQPRAALDLPTPRRAVAAPRRRAAALGEGRPDDARQADGLRRNLAVAVGNSGDADARRLDRARRLADRAFGAHSRPDVAMIRACPASAPLLLLSMPQMADPNFARTVVLLCDYTDGGRVRPGREPADGRAGVDDGQDRAAGATSIRDLRLWVGGPVDPQQTWVLMAEAQGPDDEQREICPGRAPVGVARRSTLQLLQTPPSSRARVVVGYAGWGPGQLEQELAASSWLTTDVDPQLIFGVPAGRDVGDGHPAAGRRSGRAPDELRGSLTRTEPARRRDDQQVAAILVLGTAALAVTLRRRAGSRTTSPKHPAADRAAHRSRCSRSSRRWRRASRRSI